MVRSDPYTVLGVERDADESTIKRAYRKLAMQHHPDRNPDDPEAADRFKAVADAYATLTDPAERAKIGAPSRALDGGFLADLADALDRAERWVLEEVLPHRLSEERGGGAEMVARLWRDQDDLARPTTHLPNTLWGRYAARRLASKIEIVQDLSQWAPVSATFKHGSRYQIAIGAVALKNHGFGDTVALDDAVLRLILARVSGIVGRGRFLPPLVDDPEGWDAAVEAARLRDDAVLRRKRMEWAVYIVLAATAIIMFGTATWENS